MLSLLLTLAKLLTVGAHAVMDASDASFRLWLVIGADALAGGVRFRPQAKG